ncbi:hypothetical protein SALBM311S_05153 [Streptomyces alboniger]
MFFAADKGDINTIIGGIAPDWGPFGSLGNEAKVMIEVVMAVAILLCLGIAIWGAAKQRIGATALRDTFSAGTGQGPHRRGPDGRLHHRFTGHTVHHRVRHGRVAGDHRPLRGASVRFPPLPHPSVVPTG